MKKDNRKTEYINPDMTGAGSHGFPYGNVIQVKEDVYLKSSTVKINTTGDFKIRIFEWDNGCIGAALFQKDLRFGPGTYTISFDGVKLLAGKKYWIGRVSTDPNSTDNMDNAYADRKTSVPPATFKYVDTLGGTSKFSNAIDFTSTYYYFFNLEIEAVKWKTATPKKSARSYGKKNIIEGMDTDNWTLRAGTTYKRFEGNRAYWDSNADYAGIQLILSKMGIPDSEFQGKTVTYGGKSHPSATIMLFYRKSDGVATYIGVTKPATSRTVVIPAGASELRVYIQSDSGGRGELWCEDVFLNFGTDSEYKSYEPAPKPAKLYPERNLIPDFNDEGWFQDSTTAGGTLTVDSTNPYRATLVTTASAQGRLLWIPVESGKTYTFSFGKLTGLLRLYKDRVSFHDNPKNIFQGATPVPITVTPDDTYRGFITVRLTLGSAGTVEIEDLRFQEGDSTLFTPMNRTKMKPLL
jgi:hypothetical protein